MPCHPRLGFLDDAMLEASARVAPTDVQQDEAFDTKLSLPASEKYPSGESLLARSLSLTCSGCGRSISDDASSNGLLAAYAARSNE